MREKTYSFTIEEIPIIVTKKRMKNMYLRISKEDGSVRISAPHQMSDERIYRFAKERIDWIRVYREKYLRAKEGRREVRQLSEAELKQQKLLLKKDVEKLIAKWEPVMGVKASGVTIRQMKTRWGSCNVRTHHININLALAKKPPECLEYVVSDGGGRNGQVTGYRIGGKTGTADKTGTKDVVVSFMCFAPADDPQYIMLLTMDTPSRTTGTAVFGGTMVAPVASQIMSEILPLLGVEPDYTAEELVGADTTVPNVVGQTREAAEDRLADLGFTFRTVGDGDTVTDQTPAGGAIVPNNASIILYLGAEKPDKPCTVPNVVGKSASEANKAITNAGLIMKVTGTTTASSGNVYAITQSLPAGTEVAAGTVVTVQFGDNSVLD